MFTDIQLKDFHYKMWDYIVDKIEEHKTAINIKEAKVEFLESHNIDADSILNACPMCQYNKQHFLLSDIAPCLNCPSALMVSQYRGCLAGLYGLCRFTDSYVVQSTLAQAIRDSWKE